MSETSKGIYYQSNYNEQADILKDMKLMAESIDEVIGENKYNDAEVKQNILDIQQEQTEQNTKLEENKTEIETLKAEKERLKQENLDLKNALPFRRGKRRKCSIRG